jgi:hypothetical protein
MSNVTAMNSNAIMPRDYTIIRDNADLKAKQSELGDSLNGMGKDFNNFVLASVSFFYGDGNKQVAIINTLIEMAYNAHGYNANKLCDYLVNLIPHKVEKKVRAYPMLSTREGEYPSIDVMQEFVIANPQWSRYSKEAKVAKPFSQLKYAAEVLKKLEANGVNVAEFTSLMKAG